MKKSFHPDHDDEPAGSRCWDGTLGCEQSKAEHEFRWNPRICNACTLAISMRFGVKQSDFDFLALLLAADAGLFRSAKYQGAQPEKLTMLRHTQETTIKYLLESIQKLGGDSHKIETKVMNYRKWFFEQAGLTTKEPVIASHGLPVGDI